MEDLHERIINQLIIRLERGVNPWHATWDNGPRNLVSGRPYGTVGAQELIAQGHEQPWWITARQARQLGGRIRNGERGTRIGDSQSPEQQRHREETVFNISQVEGIRPPPSRPTDRPDLEAIVAGMPSMPRLVHGGANPIYHAENDTITLPPASAFSETITYYAALFHELVHSTGHATRLNRQAIMHHPGVGSPAYVCEELTAEIGAAMLSAHTSIADATLDDSAAYLAQWVDLSASSLPILHQASDAARRATRYILGNHDPSASQRDSLYDGDSSRVAYDLSWGDDRG